MNGGKPGKETKFLYFTLCTDFINLDFYIKSDKILQFDIILLSQESVAKWRRGGFGNHTLKSTMGEETGEKEQKTSFPWKSKLHKFR